MLFFVEYYGHEDEFYGLVGVFFESLADLEDGDQLHFLSLKVLQLKQLFEQRFDDLYKLINIDLLKVVLSESF